jgi:hypothetical protein
MPLLRPFFVEQAAIRRWFEIGWSGGSAGFHLRGETLA